MLATGQFLLGLVLLALLLLFVLQGLVRSRNFLVGMSLPIQGVHFDLNALVALT